MPKDFNDESPDAPNGAILELRDEGPIELVAQRVVRHGGAALIIDYGHARLGFGDTLQAVRRHKYADPLTDPGEADLTTQVNFGELVVWARRNGAATYGPITQGEFLRRLGIERARRAAQDESDARSSQPISTRRSRA